MNGSDARSAQWLPALDGLRAVAVLLVMAFHLRLTRPFIPGGFVGVDVFFVLSGFLITTLLIDEWNRSGDISLARFYARRALRLLPALMVFFVGFLSVAALLPDVAGGHPLAVYLENVGYGLTYLYNWYLLSPSENPGGFRHVWSLAIEEQYYLAWPLALRVLLQSGRPRREILFITLGVAFASAALPYLIAPLSWKRLYFGSDFRAHALLIGSGLALLRTGGCLPRGALERPLLRTLPPVAWACLLWVALVAEMHESWLYSGGLTLVALASAVLVWACAGPGSGPMERVLRSRALVHVGRRSYALYLWHVPIAFWLRDLAPAAQLLVAVPLTFAAAEISYRLVEAPALRVKRRLAALPV